MRSVLFLAPLIVTGVVASSLLNEFQKRAGVIFPSQCASSCDSVNKTLSTNSTLQAVCTTAFQTQLYNCFECTVQYGGSADEAASIQGDDQVLSGLQANCASASLPVGAVETLTSFSTFPSLSSTSISPIVSSSSVSTTSMSSTTAIVSSTDTVSGGGFATATTAAPAATTTKSGDIRMEPSVVAAWGMCLAVLSVFLVS
ncbi:hypothetical protein FRB96_008249 [Tulasnella sp. 330]|nr:hypothetical protein FRB96_008249 [Tulasnella sp. 330]KAG8877634.1 hypothetical protein FRB97_003226 [Tulasnella sp. 331]KAG8883068.1 hypothetical protein FRB98_003334 [Tulasnella sp. 332]